MVLDTIKNVLPTPLPKAIPSSGIKNYIKVRKDNILGRNEGT